MCQSTSYQQCVRHWLQGLSRHRQSVSVRPPVLAIWRFLQRHETDSKVSWCGPGSRLNVVWQRHNIGQVRWRLEFARRYIWCTTFRHLAKGWFRQSVANTSALKIYQFGYQLSLVGHSWGLVRNWRHAQWRNMVLCDGFFINILWYTVSVYIELVRASLGPVPCLTFIFAYSHYLLSISSLRFLFGSWASCRCPGTVMWCHWLASFPAFWLAPFATVLCATMFEQSFLTVQVIDVIFRVFATSVHSVCFSLLR